VSLRNKILILVCKQFSSWESVNLTEYITTGVTFSFFSNWYSLLWVDVCVCHIYRKKVFGIIWALVFLPSKQQSSHWNDVLPELRLCKQTDLTTAKYSDGFHQVSSVNVVLSATLRPAFGTCGPRWCCSKLQSDLKTTKCEETKIALEVCYKEIQRLRSEKLAPATKSTPRYSELTCHGFNICWVIAVGSLLVNSVANVDMYEMHSFGSCTDFRYFFIAMCIVTIYLSLQYDYLVSRCEMNIELNHSQKIELH